MSLHFSVLASGSAGNASFVAANDVGVLLDFGLGPRLLQQRLRQVGTALEQVQAALLTHTHSDHWHERTLQLFVDKRIPLWCHPSHHLHLQAASAAYNALRAVQLVHYYKLEESCTIAGTLGCVAFRVPHDGGATCGFRLEGPRDFFGDAGALGYATDLGSWAPEVVAHLTDVDILALEFNHDPTLQLASGRSPHLIRRNLGANGHLSNSQAATLLRAVLQASTPGRLQHVVQLHLSAECNRPILAQQAVAAVVSELGATLQVHTAAQDQPGPVLRLGGALPRLRRPRRPRQRRATGATTCYQPYFPEWELDL